MGTCPSCLGLNGGTASTEIEPLVFEEGVSCSGYDWTKSTEANFAIPHFSGSHSELRPLLDYTWHMKYSHGRMLLQDDLIHQLTSGSSRKADMLPWVVFTAGAMGAGKGYVVRWMHENGYLPLEHFVTVDPDQIRTMLPEWPKYVEHNPLTAGNMTQKEAGCIAELLGYRALRDRRNVIFDGSLRDAEWYEQYFRLLRRNYPGIRIMILHVVADVEEVVKRAQERAKKTGRHVPESILRESAEAVPKSVQRLAEYTDVTLQVHNMPNQAPRISRSPGSDKPKPGIDVNWDFAKALWMDIDRDGDGCLSEAEVNAAKKMGIVSSLAIGTLDKDGDGRISKNELEMAKNMAKLHAADRAWK